MTKGYVDMYVGDQTCCNGLHTPCSLTPLPLRKSKLPIYLQIVGAAARASAAQRRPLLRICDGHPHTAAIVWRCKHAA